MLNVRFPLFRAFVCCYFLFFMAGCAAERQGPVADIYHNITARYNAYFLANQKMEEVEEALAEAQERNFNQLLHVFPEVDTSVISSQKAQLEDILKKASIAIERHKHSKWVDDSYILVGKTRFYNGEYEHAVETFKYVNVNSKEDEARHRALLNLMRTFIDYNELNNAKAVADYLRKEKLNKENLKKYYQTLAYFYRQREDWPYMAAALEEAAPLTPQKEGRARLYFILGQLYQQMGMDEQAYQSFEKSLRSNPDYELSFYARLNMAQVFDLAQEEDEKEIRRYFGKLLKDRKNAEYRDKIYYEIGKFEARQGNLDAAIENYQNSIEASVSNPRQKSYAYQALAELYYDTFNNYRLAEAYYDSTLQTLPPDEPDFAQVQQRREVLGELLTQLNTIQLQDSLLRLVQLDSLSLRNYLEDVVLQEIEEERQAKLAEEQRMNQVNVRPGFNTVRDNFGLTDNLQNREATWYFYNQNLLGIGQAEFIKNWGDRPLQDNWRILSGDQRENTNVVTQAMEVESAATDTPVQPDEDEIVASRTLEYYNELPLADEDQGLALAAIENAYYKLGKIYNYDLEEFGRAVAAFDTLLQRFPESELRPEVLYELYLLHKGKDEALAERYKNELVQQYPNTTFAKVALNPNYVEESDQISNYLKEAYAQAYDWYEGGTYRKADSLLNANLRQYPDNSFSDQLRLLQILIKGKTDGAAPYQYALGQFIEQTTDEQLRAYAQELLQASYKFAENNAKREGTRFIEDFNQPHYFIIKYENEKKLADQLIATVDSFNLKYEQTPDLKATNLRLTDNTFMVYVNQFPDRSSAVQYLRAVNRSNIIPAEAKNANVQSFVISRDNFQILYDSKDIDSYMKFFNKFYN